jgi:hypothetical protein
LNAYVDSDDPGQAQLRVASDWYVTLQLSAATQRATANATDSVYAAIGFLGPGAEARWSATFAGEGAAIEVCGEMTREAVLFQLLQLMRDAGAGKPSPSVLLNFAGAASQLDRAERIATAASLVPDMPHLAAALAATRDPARFTTELAASWDAEAEQWDVLGSLLVGDAWAGIRGTAFPPNLFEAVPQAADMMSVLLFQGGSDCVRFVVR